MELYVFAALLFIYIITVVANNQHTVRKIWTLAFIGAAFLTAGSLFALRIKQQDVMLTADNFNWYFFLYVFGVLAFALGLINLWMYRRPLWHIIFNDATKESSAAKIKR
jgi:uncharacterized membrane protein